MDRKRVDNSMEAMIPYNEDAECGLLCSLLIDAQAYDLVATIVQPEDFYVNAHRVIYETIVSLYNRRKPADMISIQDELIRTDRVADAGHNNKDGIMYLLDLMTIVPTSVYAEHYASIVVSLAECRRVIHAAAQIAQIGYSKDAQPIEKSEKILFNLRRTSMQNGFVNMPTLVSEYMTELDYLHDHRGAISGIPTGYTDLDACLGGLQKSDLVLLAARPSMGKTSLALGIGYNAAKVGKKVAIFSLEMGRRLLMRRMMAMASHVDMQRLRNGWIEDDEWELVVNAGGHLSELPMWINDTAGNPIASMRSELRRLAREQNGVDLVIVDYVGMIEPDVESDKRANLVQQISEISKGLKILAREFDLPVLALCQLSRAVEQRQVKIPMLSDLRDSGSLEQDADVVLFIYRDDYYHQSDAAAARSQGQDAPPYTPTNTADIIIAKHRNGPTGEVRLYWKAEETMFYDLDKRSGQEETPDDR